MSRFGDTFTTPKPILGMLHLAGDGPAAKLAQAEEEARIMAGEGVDGLVVENYFGDAEDVERVLERLFGLGARTLHHALAPWRLAELRRATYLPRGRQAGEGTARYQRHDRQGAGEQP